MTVASEALSISAAPPWAGRFCSDELDEIRAFVAQFAAEHSRVARGPGPLGYRFSWVSAATTKLGWSSMVVGQTIRGAVAVPTLHLLAPPGSRYRIGRREYVPSPGAATFIAPGWEFTRTSSPGETFALSLGEVQLTREIEARSAERRGEPVLRTQHLALETADRAMLVAAAVEVARTTGPGSSQLAVRHAEARLTALIADQILRHGAIPRGKEVSAARIAALESWIECHLDEPLTIGRLCAVSGIGERGLQKAFRSRRGMSPMRFVTERRLAAARERLIAAAPHDDVTSIAVELGFGHVGRFAQLYRQAFGEAPSESLKRSTLIAVR